jgi:GTP-binding protein Era
MANESMPIERAGRVALFGRSNVGKSTLLNAALEMPLAIVSRRPQTTRDPLLGLVRHAGAEIGFVDTPGLHEAHDRLGTEMNRAAQGAARTADVIVLVIAVPPKAKGALRMHPGDKTLAERLPEGIPAVLVINKIDLLRDKGALLPLMAAYGELRNFDATVPISALRSNGIQLVLDEVARLLPERAPEHAPDAVTDRPMRYFASEYVREQILLATSEEVPHAVAISIDGYTEPAGPGTIRIDATIHVERDGQKRIIIGTKGDMLKRIGTQARARIEALVGQQVNLQLHVRVTKRWREDPSALLDFGLVAKAKGSQ